MRKNRHALLILILVLLIFLSFYFDAEIVRFIFSLKNLYLDKLFSIVEFISSEVILLIFLTVLVFYERGKRKNLIPLWLTLFITAVVGFSLKATVQRLRPFQAGLVEILPSMVKGSYSVWNYSFPSSHMMFVFCAIPLLLKEFPKMKYWWFGFAFLVGISRIYFGLHYLSDVLVGSLLGYAVGWFIFRNKNTIIKKIAEM